MILMPKIIFIRYFLSNFNFYQLKYYVFFIWEPIIGLAIGKYFMKIIFDIKIEIMLFEISNVSNLNKS